MSTKTGDVMSWPKRARRSARSYLLVSEQQRGDGEKGRTGTWSKAMQFIVLIEFLIPGVATVLLGLALFPGVFQVLLKDVVPPSVLNGEPAAALLLLAISYPVGHMVNYPIFQILQRGLLTPRVRRNTVRSFVNMDVDLVRLVNHHLGVKVAGRKWQEELTKEEKLTEVKKLTKGELWHLFGYMRAIALSRNVEYLDGYVFFYKSLQRLARGMVCPLFLAGIFVWQRGGNSYMTLVLLLLLAMVFAVIIHLLRYSLQAEEDEVVRFFVTSIGVDTSRDVRPTQAVERADSALSRDPAAHRQ